MFVEHKEVGEKPPVKIERLSHAIREGSKTTEEGLLSHANGRPCCAIGAAAYALGFDGMSIYSDGMIEFFESKGILGAHLACQVSKMHFENQMNRLQLADWLESKGY